MNEMGIAVRNGIQEAVLKLIRKKTRFSSDSLYIPNITPYLNKISYENEIIPLLYWYFRKGLQEKLATIIKGDSDYFFKDLPPERIITSIFKIQEVLRQYFTEVLSMKRTIYFLTDFTNADKKVTVTADDQAIFNIQTEKYKSNIFLFPEIQGNSIPLTIKNAFDRDAATIRALEREGGEEEKKVEGESPEKPWVIKYKEVKFYNDAHKLIPKPTDLGWNSALNVLVLPTSSEVPNNDPSYIHIDEKKLIEDLVKFYTQLVNSYGKIFFQQLKSVVDFTNPYFQNVNFEVIMQYFTHFPKLEIKAQLLQELYKRSSLQDYLRAIYGFEEGKPHNLYNSDNPFVVEPFMEEIAIGSAIFFYENKHPEKITRLPIAPRNKNLNLKPREGKEEIE